MSFGSRFNKSVDLAIRNPDLGRPNLPPTEEKWTKIHVLKGWNFSLDGLRNWGSSRRQNITVLYMKKKTVFSPKNVFNFCSWVKSGSWSEILWKTRACQNVVDGRESVKKFIQTKYPVLILTQETRVQGYLTCNLLGPGVCWTETCATSILWLSPEMPATSINFFSLTNTKV